MRSLVFILFCFVSFQTFSQEAEIGEEFLPINIEEKEAFLSTKTGEYVFLEHAEIDASKLETTSSGVIYTDIKTHTVAKKETLSKISKKYGLSTSEIVKQNKLPNTKLSIGQKLKIIKKIAVKSSSPVISQKESKIIARLNPGQTPTGLDAVPPVRAPVVYNNTETVVEDSNEKVVVVKEEKETEVQLDDEEISEIKDAVKEAVKDVEVTEIKDAVEEVKEAVKKEVVKDAVEEVKVEIEEVKEEIPTTETPSLYSVKKGDNLYNIAKKHGVTVEALKKLNDLTSNNLSIGQKLKLK